LERFNMSLDTLSELQCGQDITNSILIGLRLFDS